MNDWVSKYDEFQNRIESVEEFAVAAYDSSVPLESILVDIDDTLNEPTEVSIGCRSAIVAAGIEGKFETMDAEQIEAPVIKVSVGLREFEKITRPPWTNLLNRPSANVATESGRFKTYFGVDDGGTVLHSNQLTDLTVKLPSESALRGFKKLGDEYPDHELTRSLPDNHDFDEHW